MSDHLERVTAFVEAWESHDADHNCRSGYIMPPRPKMGLAPGGVSLDRDDLRALVADAQQLRAQGAEFGIRIDYVSTLREERAVADNLADAQTERDRIADRPDVVSCTVVRREVGEWREDGDGRG